MSCTQNNNALPVCSDLSSVHLYLGGKNFGWSLTFIGEAIDPGSLMLRARIHIYGDEDVSYDSEKAIEVCGPTSQSKSAGEPYCLTFNAHPLMRVKPIEQCPSDSYGGYLDKNCTVSFYVTKSNDRYLIEVCDVEIPIKWVVGARHIVMVDPPFPKPSITSTSRVENPAIAEINVFSSETANN